MNPDILSLFHELLMAIITACAPVIAFKLMQLVGLSDNAKLRDIIATAIDRGSDKALQHGQALLDPLLQNGMNKYSALQEANSYVMKAAGQEAAKLGVSEAALAEKVALALAGKLQVPVAATVVTSTTAVEEKLDPTATPINTSNSTKSLPIDVSNAPNQIKIAGG